MINLLKTLSTASSTYTDHLSPNQMTKGGYTLKMRLLWPSPAFGPGQKVNGNSKKLSMKIHFKPRV